MTTYIATLNLPDTLNFELADEDAAKLPSNTKGTPSKAPAPRLPKPNLLETLSKSGGLSAPSSASNSPTTEFPPGGSRREFFSSVSSALAALDTEGPTRPQFRRKLTQPPSRATSPPLPPVDVPRGPTYGPGPSPPRTRKRGMTVSDKLWADAKWTSEKQQFGVNGGLINAVKSAQDAGALQDYTWIGTLGMPTDSLSSKQKSDITKYFTIQKKSIPVFISDANLEGHYNRYCKQILWPTFHYQIPDNPKFKSWENESWDHYIAVNKAFADAIVSQYKRGDAVWVNDYHLLLVPRMVREMIPHAMIGLFLHIAFPSSEVFRCLPARRDLLEGALGSTLVSFQTQEYARHFLQTCSRILAVETVESGCMLDDGRVIRVNTDPIGIDVPALEAQILDPQVSSMCNFLKDRYAGKKLLVSRDKFDHIKGLKPKLLAYERFLSDHPEWKEKVVFIQVALLGAGAEEDILLSDVTEIVTRINSMYGGIIYQPMIFRHQDTDFLEYLGMLCAADALVITSLREGWNLTSHEYVVCQETGNHGFILSEFIGSASAFTDAAILVNPWDIKGMADAMHKVLTLTPEESNARWEKAFNHVKTHDATNWVTGFLNQLKNAYIEQQRGVPTVLPKLNVDTYSEKYKYAEKRLFVVDYEETLVAWASGPGIVLTTQPRVVSVLNDLAADPRNIVYVMSGETTSALEKFFRQSPNVGLIAENGGFIKAPGQKKWVALAKNADFSWRQHVEKIFQYYQERTPGSTIEEKETSLVFHYEDSDPRDAERQARECANHINDSCPPTVHAVQGDYFVVAEPTVFTKATACAHLYSTLSTPPSFLFVAGNDRTDEDVFKWANALEKEGKVKCSVTVSVGARRTEARSYVTGTQAILGALRILATRGGGGLRLVGQSQGNMIAAKN